MKRILKTIFIWGLWIIFLFITIAVSQLGVDFIKTSIKKPKEEKTHQVVEKLVNEKLVETTKQLSKQLPLRVDEHTTLINVVAGSKTMRYFYEISLKKEDLDVDLLMAKIEKLTKNNICSMKNTRELLDLDVNLIYLYRINEKYIGELFFDKETCSK